MVHQPVILRAHIQHHFLHAICMLCRCMGNISAHDKSMRDIPFQIPSIIGIQHIPINVLSDNLTDGRLFLFPYDIRPTDDYRHHTAFFCRNTHIKKQKDTTWTAKENNEITADTMMNLSDKHDRDHRDSVIQKMSEYAESYRTWYVFSVASIFDRSSDMMEMA